MTTRDPSSVAAVTVAAPVRPRLRTAPNSLRVAMPVHHADTDDEDGSPHDADGDALGDSIRVV